ncbi:Mu transposase C-terminal domain-containing protein [Nonomuraea sp. H19]|uniref:Mu transposase C-terminal domain-containing protein n=1 Tax=Nonomuraea sp. H19 TaxID=3452206 RepID=UPI003F8C7229
MTVSRPPRVKVGEQIRWGGALYVVRQISDGQAVLENVTGVVSVVPLSCLIGDPALELVTSAPPAPLPATQVLDGLPDELVERARWWEGHILQVLATSQAGAALPAVSLRQRELAKVAELVAQGHRVSFTTFKRQRRAYEQHGLLGLVDQRALRPETLTGRIDERVVTAVQQAIAAETGRSTGTVTRLRHRVEQILEAEHGPGVVPVPGRATFYRLIQRLSQGQHTFDSARTRRSLAKRPNGPFGTKNAVRPGEWMQIDSTPLDVAVVHDNGAVDRVELTWMIDLATRSITAAVLSPTTKAVDAALLLARTLTPEPVRPGWSDALRMARSVLPHRRMVEIDERLEHAAARPVIVPETIVCDHGKAYLSQAFRNACRAMGINVQPTHKGSPWEKGTVERSFDSLDTLFSQYVAGYLGTSVERRGQDASAQAVWSMLELQELLDEWIVAAWQNRPHDGLRDPLTPAAALTPNQKYAALVEIAGYVPVPLAGSDYIELLPACWRAINSYGIKINHRRYDSPALNPYRRQHSGLASRRGLWEVHFDPYDVSRIWVRNHHDGGWITVGWTHLSTTPAPFGELAWDHARKILARQGVDAASEQEIAQVVRDLLTKAEQGPQRPGRDDRVAGRTATTAAVVSPMLPYEDEPDPDHVTEPDGTESEREQTNVAKVIPLPIFDAREEANKWRF